MLTLCDQEQADMIVIGRGGRREARDYLVGSVAERIVRHAAVSVFVVR